MIIGELARQNVYGEHLNRVSKRTELEAKHGVKMVGSWGMPSEHLAFEVFEAPSYEAIQAYSMEPEKHGHDEMANS